MAVLESNPHPVTVRASSTPYGCSNMTYRDGYWIKTRQYAEDGTYEMVDTFIKHVMSKECRYDHSLTDQRCQFCDHRGTGEIYDQMIRSKGK